MDTKNVQKFRRERLLALSDIFKGYAGLGRALGYRDGAYVAQLIKGIRPISEDFVAKCEALPKFGGWFHDHEEVDGLFSTELITHIRLLSAEERKRLETLLRSALNLPLPR